MTNHVKVWRILKEVFDEEYFFPESFYLIDARLCAKFSLKTSIEKKNLTGILFI